jgi:hypothetical protein
MTPLGHLIQSERCPLAFNYTYESLFYVARVSFYEGRQIKETEDHNEELRNVNEKMRTSKCFATDGSKMENKPFVGLPSIHINDGISWRSRITKVASTFTAEALTIGETLEIRELTRSKIFRFSRTRKAS